MSFGVWDCITILCFLCGCKAHSACMGFWIEGYFIFCGMTQIMRYVKVPDHRRNSKSRRGNPPAGFWLDKMVETQWIGWEVHPRFIHDFVKFYNFMMLHRKTCHFQKTHSKGICDGFVCMIKSSKRLDFVPVASTKMLERMPCTNYLTSTNYTKF